VGPNGEVKLADFGMAKHVCSVYFLTIPLPPMYLHSITIRFSLLWTYKVTIDFVSECRKFCTTHVNLFACAS